MGLRPEAKRSGDVGQRGGGTGAMAVEMVLRGPGLTVDYVVDWRHDAGAHLVTLAIGHSGESSYASSRPRIEPFDDANALHSMPRRWSMETKRLGSG